MGQKPSISITLIPTPHPVLKRLDRTRDMQRLVPELTTDYLLNEAVRFYEWGLRDNPYFRTDQFAPLDAASLASELGPFESRFGQKVYRQMEQLWYRNRQRHLISKERVDPHIRALLKDWFGAAPLAVLLSTTKSWRNDRFEPERFIAFDRVARFYHEINRRLEPSYILEDLKKSYGQFYTQIVRPIGGDLIVTPQFDRFPGEAPFGSNPRLWRDLFYNMEPVDIGLSEKLCTLVALEPFYNAILKSPLQDHRKAAEKSSCKFLRDALTLQDELMLVLQPGTKKNALRLIVFKSLFKSIDALELVFLRATTDHSHAQWSGLFGRNAATVLGLPWAFYLTSVLRLQLLKQLVVAFFSGIPYTRIYRDLNGYIAVGLLEAVYGIKAGHLFQTGMLPPIWAIPFQSGASLRIQHVQPAQIKEPKTIVEAAAALYREMVNAADAEGMPIGVDGLGVSAVAKWWGDMAAGLAGITTTLDDDLNAPTPPPVAPLEPFGLIVNPPIRESFYIASGLKRQIGWVENGQTFYRSEAIYGANFIAQAHAYVACQLLQKAVSGINGEEPRISGSFTVGSGSFLWGGRFRDHFTHRDGYCFDWDYLPVTQDDPAVQRPRMARARNQADFFYQSINLPPWPMLAGTKVLQQYRTEIKKNRKGKSEDPNIREWEPPANCAEWTKATPVTAMAALDYWLHDHQKAAMTLSLRPENLVFREFFKQRLNTLLQAATEMFDEYPERAGDQNDEFRELERQLAGTPLFNNELINKGFQVAHTCVYLSAPLQIVWASPIMHIRTLQAIHQFFGSASEELFEAIRKLVKTTSFAFLPHNHNNHWHIEYWYRNEQYMNSLRRWKRVPDDLGSHSHFAQNFPLWIALDIDMDPLAEYLIGYQAELASRGQTNDAVRRSIDEIEDILRMLQRYNEERAEYFNQDSQIDHPRFWEAIGEVADQELPVFTRETAPGTLLDDVRKCSHSYFDHVYRWSRTREKTTLKNMYEIEEELADTFLFNDEFFSEDEREFLDPDFGMQLEEDNLMSDEELLEYLLHNRAEDL